MTLILRRNARRIVAIAMFISGISGAVFAEPPNKVKGNGGYLAASGYDTSGCIWSIVEATRAGTTAAPTTWLSYDVYNVCAGQWLAWGQGFIPNTALKIASNNKTATLALTPSSSASFHTQGETGAIRITLTVDGVYSYSYSGHARQEYAGHVYHSHGSWTSRSASVTGAVLGFAAGSMTGTIGQGRDRYMEFDRGSK